ncbi:MAG: hypothetical protein GX483_05770 [Actinomycetaceae bacterium]|nr:hypothetical protein [Actinomycetaceae bacterium]
MGVIISLILGGFSGVVGMIAHAGPLDQPLIGLALASVLVAVGAWLARVRYGASGGTAYVIGVVGVTLWLSYAPPADDTLIAVPWAAQVWVFLSALSAGAGLLIALVVDRRSSSLSGIKPLSGGSLRLESTEENE